MTMTSSFIATGGSLEGVQQPRLPRRKTPVSSRTQRTVVLQALREAPEALTVQDLAAQLNCACVTVRRHLKALRAEDQIRNVGTRQRLRPGPDGEPTALPGRPFDLYVATAA